MELAPLSMAFAFGSMVMICRWIIIHLPIITLARCLQSPSEHHNSVDFQDRYLINGNLLAPFFLDTRRARITLPLWGGLGGIFLL